MRLEQPIPEQAIRAKLETTLRRSWHGVVPVEQGIEAAIQFRNMLCDEHQRFFDALLIEGVLPENAAQTLQFAIDQGVLLREMSDVAVGALR
jgi:hypothetical protein